MNGVAFLAELAVVSAFAVGIAILLRRLHLPVVSLLLLAGVVVGPHALGLVSDVKKIEAVADPFPIVLTHLRQSSRADRTRFRRQPAHRANSRTTSRGVTS